MRVDTEQASGAQSHTISNGERTWVWYGGSELYYESAAAFTADEEQGIPTYEDILRLDKKRIAAAVTACSTPWTASLWKLPPMTAATLSATGSA